ncbi:hypothetical protein [uncultured Acinetobacter sp.]|uniref:hypothetical protein n=1 Tax=uncultured Acinetobacter sp. TaxID=165433 RepID=UPI0025E1A6E5|nr:hypothetical protein [uncultured Acinetobacter sp.]
MTIEQQPTDTPNDNPTDQTQASLLGGQQQQQPNNGDQQPADTPVVTTAPENIDGYQVNVEGFDFDEFKSFDENKEFLERARAAGFDNEKLGFLLGEYNQLLPKIMEANASMDNEACITAMKETWGADTDSNFKFAQAAANNAIQNGILTPEEINSPQFGNNPLVLKMAAYFGQQLSEDLPPSNTQQNSPTDVTSLMKSEAYRDVNHPDHKRVYAQVENAYQKQYK